MKVTLDINVLLDVFQRREPHYAASAKVVILSRIVGVDNPIISHPQPVAVVSLKQKYGF